MNSDYKRFIDHKAEMCKGIDSFSPELYGTHDVKKGLRDSKGNGVVVGLTTISQVDGTEMVDGVKTPCQGSSGTAATTSATSPRGSSTSATASRSAPTSCCSGAFPTRRSWRSSSCTSPRSASCP